MLGAPQVWDALLTKLSVIAAGFLRVQVEAGASAVQLFDSWAGGLAPDDYRTHVLPHSSAVFAADRRPRRCRASTSASAPGRSSPTWPSADVEVVGVDWRVPLDQAARRIRPGQAVQGNLDSTAVFAPWEVIEAKARDVIQRGRSASGHIFNLGHGVLPATDPDVLARLVELVHSVD